VALYFEKMKTWTIKLEELDRSELAPEDFTLVDTALARLPKAHAPYSRFHVAAAIRLGNGQVLVGTNQENSSFPVGICAERVALSAASSLAPGMAVTAMAVVYAAQGQTSSKPLPPCGMCRQALHEQKTRQNAPLELLMCGVEGPVWKAADASDLLPFAFSGEELP
jgi:cytidine deaminase